MPNKSVNYLVDMINSNIKFDFFIKTNNSLQNFLIMRKVKGIGVLKSKKLENLFIEILQGL